MRKIKGQSLLGTVISKNKRSQDRNELRMFKAHEEAQCD